MSYRFSNNYNTVLIAPVGAADTTIRVADPSGLPDTSTGNTFTLTLESADSLKLEIVLATAVSGDTITVTRAQENTLALSFAVNDNVTLRLTAGALNSFSQNGHGHTLADIADAGTMAAEDDAPIDGRVYGRNDSAWVEVDLSSPTISHPNIFDRDAADSHPIAAITGLQPALDGKEPAFAKNTAFNKNFGGNGVSVEVSRADHTHQYVAKSGDTMTGPLVLPGDAVNPLEAVPLQQLEAYAPEGAMKWKGEWAAGEYNQYDVVEDAGWLMIANKTTSERPSPQAVGDATFSIPDAPVWAELTQQAVVYTGALYTFTQGGWWRQIRVWVPELSDSTNYRFVIVRNPNSATPIYTVLEEPVLVEDGWTTLAAGDELVAAGEEVLVYIDALNTGSNTTWQYPWTYLGTSNTVAPTTGNWNTNTSLSLLRIHKDDGDAINHQLELDVVPGTIFEISQLDTPSNYVHYRTEGAPVDAGTHYEYQVTQVEQGAGGPAIGSGTQIRAVQPVAQPTQYVEQADHWVAGQPTWATVQGFKQYDGVDQPGNENSAYGIDIQFQPGQLSADWDYMNHASGGGGGGGGADEFIGLVDTPGSYGGSAGYYVIVNQTEDGLLFTDAGGGGGIPDAPADGSHYARKDATWDTVTHAKMPDRSDANAHPISAITGLQGELDGKEPAFVKNTAFNKNFGGGGVADTVARGDHLHDGNYAPIGHDHAGVYEPVISPKNSAFNRNFGGSGIADTVARSDHNHTGVYSPVGHGHVWADISDPPATYPPSAHDHAWADITDPPATYPPSAHTHVEADVTDLDKYTQAEVDAAIATRVGYGADNTVAGAKISVVSAMPGTPESDVIYFVTG